jgi:hypothetical protein
MNIPKITDIESACLNDATVYQILKQGGGLEDVVVALAQQKQEMIQKIAHLEMIAPRKITAPDGRIFVYRCPTKLIPETPCPTQPKP